MTNLFSYLDNWGDIPFSEKAFCDVDNLVLSYLAYAELDGIVPSVEAYSSITVQDANEAFVARHQDEKEGTLEKHTANALRILHGMASGKRYQGAKLSGYVSEFDTVSVKQFAALMAELEDGTVYIAFRGTDDSLISWHEDFNMCFETTQAEEEAVCYLNEVTKSIDRPIRVGGHSKGGHLAVYASMMCFDDIKAQIIGVYNNDGPGLRKDLIDDPRYGQIREKVLRIVPAYAVIGQLFHHDDRLRIIQSAETGLMQHDCVSWVVEEMDFIEADRLENKAVFLNRVLEGWLEQMTREHKKMFVGALFDSLDGCGIVTFSGLMSAETAMVLKTVRNMRPMRKMIRQTVVALFASVVEAKVEDVRQAVRTQAA